MATVLDVLGDELPGYVRNFQDLGMDEKEIEAALREKAQEVRGQKEGRVLSQIGRGLKEGAYGTFAAAAGLANLKTDILTGTAHKLFGLPKAPQHDILKGASPKLREHVDDELANLEATKQRVSRRGYLQEIENIKNKENPTQKELDRAKKIAQRFDKKDALNKAYEESEGFLEGAKAGIANVWDDFTHPGEWTIQGVTAFIANLENALSLSAGGAASRLGKTTLQKGIWGAGAGALEGATVNPGLEYARSLGLGMSHDDAKKAAATAGAVGAVTGLTMGGAGAAGRVYFGGEKSGTKGASTPSDASSPDVVPSKETSKLDELSQRLQNNELFSDESGNALNEAQVGARLEDSFDGKVVKDGQKEYMASLEADKNSLEFIKSVDEVEVLANELHEQTKLQLREMVEAGASIDELVAFRNSLRVDESEKIITKIINNDELMSKRLTGFRIVNVMEDTIKSSKLTPEAVMQKLLSEGVEPELANAATRSYVIRDIEVLQDYIHNRLESHLELESGKIRDDIKSKIEHYNREKLADDEAWSNSLTKQELDEFIDTNIGKGNILDAQRELIYELNKMGLVEELDSARLGENVAGQYDAGIHQIALNSGENVPGVIKAQVLAHEYVHSATVKMMQNQRFKADVDFLMQEAKSSFKANKIDAKEYGFKNGNEFIAEAFSNPYFARDLNRVRLSTKAKERLGVKQYINTLWEAVYQKFGDVVFATTGKRLKVSDDSYFSALQNLINKERNKIDAIKKGVQGDAKLRQDSFERFSDRKSLGEDQGTSLMADVLENRYIKNGRLNVERVQQDAKPFVKKPYTLDEFAKDFGTKKIATIKTPLGEVRMNVRSQFFKLRNWKEDRTRLSGVVKSTLEDPLFIVKHHGANKYYAPYKDKNGLVHMVSVSEREGKIDIVKSNYEPFNEIKVKELMSVPNEDLLYVRGRDDTGSVARKHSSSMAEESTSKGSIAKESGNIKMQSSSKDPNIMHSENSLNRPSPKVPDSKTPPQERPIKVGDVEYGVGDALGDFLQNAKNLLGLLPHRLEGKTVVEKYRNGVDILVDNTWEGILNLGESLSYLLKYPLEAVTQGKVDSNQRWLTVSKHQMKVHDFMMEHRARQAQIYEASGAIKRDLEQTLTKEQNKDLVRALNGDKDPALLDGKLKDIYETFRATIDKNADDLVDAGLLDSKDKIEHYVKRFYERYVGENKKSGGSIAFERLKKRKDLTHEERVAMGMIEDASFVVPQTIAEQRVMLEKAQILKELSDAFGHAEQIDGYIRISDATTSGGIKQYGALAGKYVHPDVFKEVRNTKLALDELNVIERGLFAMVDHLKVNMTVKNPFTHLYNVGANVLLSALKGDTMELARVLVMMRKNPEQFRALVKEANKYGLNTMLDDMEAYHAVARPDGRLGVIPTIWKNMYLSQDSKIGHNVRKLYDWEDKIYKLASFSRNLKQGMDPKTAFTEANKLYVNYSTPLPGAIRLLDKTGLMPFLHYQFKSTPEAARVMLKHPLRAFLIGSAVWARDAFVFQDEEDQYYKPGWAKNKFNLFGVKEWYGLGNGWYINSGRMLPGTKFEFELGGFITSAIGVVGGKTPLGYNIGRADDSAGKKLIDRVLAMTETFFPSATLGRYMQRAVHIGLAELGAVEPRKNYYDEDMGIKELAGRGVGIRRFNPEKEVKTHYSNARKKYNRDKENNPERAAKEFQRKTKEIKDAALKINASVGGGRNRPSFKPKLPKPPKFNF